MNFKLTASILVVMLGLLAVVIYLRHQSPGRRLQSHGQIFPASKSPVIGLTFSTAAKPTLHMAKRGAHWYILSPRKAWGRDFAIGELCHQITALKYHFRVHLASTGKYTAAKLGLKPARASLVLTRADGKKLTLQIGRSTLGGRLYVATNSHYASVVRRSWLKKLLNGESHFAAKSLTRFHAAAVEAITIKRGPTKLRIVRHGKGWVIKSPLLARANPTKVTNWISNLQLLAAHRFASTKEPKLKHVVFQAIVTFRQVPPANGLPTKAKAKTPPPLVVSFGSYTDLTHNYIRALSNANPNIAIVHSTSFTQLERSLSHFQDRALTRAKLTAATGITITRASAHMPLAPATLHLILKGGVWKMGTSTKAFATGPLLPVRAASVTQLLQKLAAVRAKSCNNAPPPKLKNMHPIGTLSINLPHRLHPLVITFGPGDKGGLSPVKVSGWKTIYMVSTVHIKPLLPTAAALRSHTVAQLPAANLHRIALRQGSKVVQLAKVHGRWVIEPGAKKLSQVDVASLTAELSPIRCHAWLTSAPQPANAVQANIYYAASTATSGKEKKQPPATTALRRCTLRIWSKMVAKASKGKKAGQAKKKYFAQWLTAHGSASAWVFTPSQSLVSGVMQLISDGTGHAATTAK